MAEIETSVLRIGSNDLVLQDSAVRGSLAAAYSASSTYAVGDMVLKDGQLYECNTAITTAEAWTAAHWTQTNISDAVANAVMALFNRSLSLTDTQKHQARDNIGAIKFSNFDSENDPSGFSFIY